MIANDDELKLAKDRAERLRASVEKLRADVLSLVPNATEEQAERVTAPLRSLLAGTEEEIALFAVLKRARAAVLGDDDDQADISVGDVRALLAALDGFLAPGE